MNSYSAGNRFREKTLKGENTWALQDGLDGPPLPHSSVMQRMHMLHTYHPQTPHTPHTPHMQYTPHTCTYYTYIHTYAYRHDIPQHTQYTLHIP